MGEKGSALVKKVQRCSDSFLGAAHGQWGSALPGLWAQLCHRNKAWLLPLWGPAMPQLPPLLGLGMAWS